MRIGDGQRAAVLSDQQRKRKSPTSVQQARYTAESRSGCHQKADVVKLGSSAPKGSSTSMARTRPRQDHRVRHSRARRAQQFRISRTAYARPSPSPASGIRDMATQSAILLLCSLDGTCRDRWSTTQQDRTTAHRPTAHSSNDGPASPSPQGNPRRRYRPAAAPCLAWSSMRGLPSNLYASAGRHCRLCAEGGCASDRCRAAAHRARAGIDRAGLHQRQARWPVPSPSGSSFRHTRRIAGIALDSARSHCCIWRAEALSRDACRLPPRSAADQPTTPPSGRVGTLHLYPGQCISA